MRKQIGIVHFVEPRGSRNVDVYAVQYDDESGHRRELMRTRDIVAAVRAMESAA